MIVASDKAFFHAYSIIQAHDEKEVKEILKRFGEATKDLNVNFASVVVTSVIIATNTIFAVKNRLDEGVNDEDKLRLAIEIFLTLLMKNIDYRWSKEQAKKAEKTNEVRYT